MENGNKTNSVSQLTAKAAHVKKERNKERRKKTATRIVEIEIL